MTHERPTCNGMNCARPAVTRGMCRTHYARLYRSPSHRLVNRDIACGGGICGHDAATIVDNVWYCDQHVPVTSLELIAGRRFTLDEWVYLLELAGHDPADWLPNAEVADG